MYVQSIIFHSSCNDNYAELSAVALVTTQYHEVAADLELEDTASPDDEPHPAHAYESFSWLCLLATGRLGRLASSS